MKLVVSPSYSIYSAGHRSGNGFVVKLNPILTYWLKSVTMGRTFVELPRTRRTARDWSDRLMQSHLQLTQRESNLAGYRVEVTIEARTLIDSLQMSEEFVVSDNWEQRGVIRMDFPIAGYLQFVENSLQEAHGSGMFAGTSKIRLTFDETRCFAELFNIFGWAQDNIRNVMRHSVPGEPPYPRWRVAFRLRRMNAARQRTDPVQLMYDEAVNIPDEEFMQASKVDPFYSRRIGQLLKWRRAPQRNSYTFSVRGTGVPSRHRFGAGIPQADMESIVRAMVLYVRRENLVSWDTDFTTHSSPIPLDFHFDDEFVEPPGPGDVAIMADDPQILDEFGRNPRISLQTVETTTNVVIEPTDDVRGLPGPGVSMGNYFEDLEAQFTPSQSVDPSAFFEWRLHPRASSSTALPDSQRRSSTFVNPFRKRAGVKDDVTQQLTNEAQTAPT
jgi:hypothetical protein